MPTVNQFKASDKNGCHDVCGDHRCDFCSIKRLMGRGPQDDVALQFPHVLRDLSGNGLAPPEFEVS